MYKDIADYGIIGNMRSVAMVSSDGSIDYCSMPHLDSPTVFAALLDDEKGGYFSIRPQGAFEAGQSYIKDTNILSCRFKAKTGEALLIDYMPVSGEELFEKEEHIIHRCLKVVAGRMSFALEFFPRPQYASGLPVVEKKGHAFTARLKGEVFTLNLRLGRYELEKKKDAGFVMRFLLEEGESAHFDFTYGGKIIDETGVCGIKETEKFWHDWLHRCAGQRCAFFGEYEGMVNRSLLALKLLTFLPTGAIAAAATTSLPESIESGRNWDYRFTWIRDASFTLKAMFNLGHITEADIFVRWLHGIYKQHGSRDLQIMYSLEGRSGLTEKILGHLKGYRGSRPVRVGNDAHRQNQWDIYGEVMDTALRLSDYAGKIDQGLWPFFRDICNLALHNWRKPDNGVWEVRNGPYHFVYSKVMCWVALDRGLKIAKKYGFDAPIVKWEKGKDIIKKEVLKKGYDADLGSFLQRYGSKDVDASLLLLPLMNFLPINDKRIQGTMERCRDNLLKDGFVLRYSSPDGLKGKEGGFVLCNFWLIENLALSGNIDEAKNMLSATKKAANHLGLFSEEYDSKNKKMLGNFPQAFSHIGYINAASAIVNAGTGGLQKAQPPLLKRMKKLIPVKIILNKTDVKYDDATKDIAAKLKISLGNLQGAFFNYSEGRVNYEAMRRSKSYKRYVELSNRLNSFDPFTLKTDKEKKAFWINIYNILIIHGVIELNIKNSVKEVFNFFGRIGYNIGGSYFTPDDIEHGILRANKTHPGSKMKQFSLFDKRRALSLNSFDPRIHFALVCASGSCPPIEFYDSEKIDGQLDMAGKSFINRRGLTLDRNNNILELSQIFKWYAKDFGKTKKAFLSYILQFTGSQIREYVISNPDTIKITYSPYDWNLNKVIT